jgi:hypothetical protein
MKQRRLVRKEWEFLPTRTNYLAEKGRDGQKNSEVATSLHLILHRFMIIKKENRRH